MRRHKTPGEPLNQQTAKRLGRIALDELRCAMTSIDTSGHPRPFYMSFLVRDMESWEIAARFGTLSADAHERKRNCFCDVRVGSYEYDQVQDGGLQDNSKDDDSYHCTNLPFGPGDAGLQHGLWRLAEVRYREAAEEYARRTSLALTFLDRNRAFPSFQHREAVSDSQWSELAKVDRRYWCRFVEEASALLRDYHDIKDCSVELRVQNRVSVFASSEDALLIQSQPYWSLRCQLWMLSETGDAFPWTIHHFVCDPSELPDQRRFQAEIRTNVRTLRKLAQASLLRSYSGPVLLDPVPAGLLVHEAIGHRLEGNRLLSSGEGQTFRDSLGAQILPEFLSIRDDPRLKRFQGKSLVGHYAYDDEGVPAEDAQLVQQGILRGFLTSRAGITKDHQSNGHGRNDSFERPISRMAVTKVEAENGLNAAELKAALIAEVKRRRLPFGIRILAGSGGETATDAYNFQAFLGEIDLAAKVYPDGREEIVRGVDFVGTPLNAMGSILAAGSHPEVDNANCGAESGWVPVSTISPALLVGHLELQAKIDSPLAQHCYPMPWERA
jgi:TldD protein